MAVYKKNSLVNCRGEFHDPDNGDALFDPATPTFKMRDPGGTSTTYVYPTNAQVIRDSTGKYRVQVQGVLSGTWDYHFDSPTGNIAYGDNSFEIDYSPF